MASVMKKDEHYGIIPGCGKKPSLLKPGAEKLCFVFRLSPEFEINRADMGNGHREYEIVCRLRSMSSGQIVGEGVGLCSTMETKYRYRNDADYEVLDTPIPKDSKERRSEYRKQGFGMKKVDDVWVWVKYTSEGKVENPDIADTYNTVLKMAKKRAHVDATITACAASDIFTQDIEDLPQSESNHELARPAEDKTALAARLTAELGLSELDKRELFARCDKSIDAYIKTLEARLFARQSDSTIKPAANAKPPIQSELSTASDQERIAEIWDALQEYRASDDTPKAAKADIENAMRDGLEDLEKLALLLNRIKAACNVK
jgi:hypothetical protein